MNQLINFIISYKFSDAFLKLRVRNMIENLFLLKHKTD
jgi:hypothetical protein